MLNLAKLLLVLYVKSMAVMSTNAPHETVFKASRYLSSLTFFNKRDKKVWNKKRISYGQTADRKKATNMELSYELPLLTFLFIKIIPPLLNKKKR